MEPNGQFYRVGRRDPELRPPTRGQERNQPAVSALSTARSHLQDEDRALVLLLLYMVHLLLHPLGADRAPTGSPALL